MYRTVAKGVGLWCWMEVVVGHGLADCPCGIPTTKTQQESTCCDRPVLASVQVNRPGCARLALPLTPLCNPHLCPAARSHWSSGTDKRTRCWRTKLNALVVNEPQAAVQRGTEAGCYRD